MSVDECRVLDFPKIKDHRGNLTFLEGHWHVPFDIKRVYYLYDVPGGESRAGHAHRLLTSVIIAINGSFDVHLDDGKEKRIHRLSRANEGLYLCTGIWRELHNFTSGSVCLVLASEPYDEGDYYRSYPGFLKAGTRRSIPQVKSVTQGVPFLDLKAAYLELKPQLDEAVARGLTVAGTSLGTSLDTSRLSSRCIRNPLTVSVWPMAWRVLSWR